MARMGWISVSIAFAIALPLYSGEAFSKRLEVPMKHLDQLRIEMPAALLHDVAKGSAGAPGFFVMAGRCERIEYVDDAHDPPR